MGDGRPLTRNAIQWSLRKPQNVVKRKGQNDRLTVELSTESLTGKKKKEMGAIIQDEFAGLDISRQRRYQLRKKAKGLCVQCGDPALFDMATCEPCREANYRAVLRHQGKPKKRLVNTKLTRAKAIERQEKINHDKSSTVGD